jgi:hypothetical protein
MDDLLLEYCSCKTAEIGASVVVNKLSYEATCVLGVDMTGTMQLTVGKLEPTASVRSSSCRSLVSLTVLD